MTLPKIAAIQMNSNASSEDNLQAATAAITVAARDGAGMVVLPEMFIRMGKPVGAWVEYAEPYGDGPLQLQLSQLAKKLGIWIVAGTLPISGDVADKAYASCLVFDDTGLCVQRYDKMHLFDVTVTPGNECYEESAFAIAGTKPATFDSPWGKMGLAVCYDLRFPGLFMHYAAQQCDAIIVPAAFTAKTGIAHFETLVRARALDCLAYVITANQTGTHPGDLQTYGHSMIVGPWGNILAACQSRTNTIFGTIDRELIKDIRQRFPLQMHDKFASELKD